MRKDVRHLAAAAFALFLGACGGGNNEDEPGAKALLANVQAQSYRSWQRAPGWETRQPTVSVHGQTADIFVNEVLSSALSTQGLGAWPVGAVLVKDAYRGGDLSLIAIMEKRDSGWFFAEFSANEEVKYSGQPDVCLGCHQAATDSVLSVGLP